MVDIDNYYYVPVGIVFESSFTKLFGAADYVPHWGEEVWLDHAPSSKYYTEHRYDKYDTE